MTIGERLEEARKRKGVSVREAAEATKIRGDFLLAMENNSFDINLPEIYTRGFLKIYANFLKLDVDKIVTDYEAVRMGGRKTTTRTQTLAPQNASMSPNRRETAAAAVASGPGPATANGRSSFGRMEIGEAPSAVPPTAEAGDPARAPVPGPEDEVNERAIYYKLGLVIGGLALLVVIVGIVVASLGGNKPEINPGLANGPGASAPASSPIHLIATDTVTVRVIQRSDDAKLWEGTLSAGQRETVNATGPVELRYTNGAGLTVERNGQRRVITTTGMGRSTID